MNRVKKIKTRARALFKKGMTHTRTFRDHVGRRVAATSFKKLPSTKSFKSLFLRFTTKDQTLFAKRLSFLVKAGVPLVESLHLIRKQTKSPAKLEVYDSVIHDVSSGQYLSSSLLKFRNLFGDFTINLIRIGETSGVLSQNLLYLADELQKKQTLKRKVVGALIYPVFITIATLGVTGMITVYIFPKIMPIFASLHADLPLTTRMLIWVSSFLASWGILLILGLIVAFILFMIARAKSETLRYRADWLLLKLPLVGALARNYNLANICRTMGLLLRSGLYVSESMLVVAETTPNRVYRRACESVSESILKGEPISRSLERYGEIFPETLTHMIAIGETTGNLSGTLAYLSEMHEEEVEELTKGLSASIEPILMVVMGLLVGLIAVSVITPIYGITQHLTPR